jgi:hypothetical protein
MHFSEISSHFIARIEQTELQYESMKIFLGID